MSDPYVKYTVGATPEDTFVVPFQFWEREDLLVRVGVFATSDYNITGAGDPTGGSIILITPVTNTEVEILRVTQVQRISDFPIAGPFRIEALNDEFNHIYAVLQDLEFGQEIVTIDWNQVINKPTEYPPEAHTHTESEITDLDRMRWAGDWVQQTYEKNDLVLDWPYTMVANKQTTDRPAPQDVGNSSFVYTGSDPTQAITAKTLLVGNTYTTPVAMKIPSVRVYTIAGNVYSVYVRNVTTGYITEFLTFTADTTGWFEIAGPGNVLAAGTQLEVALYVTEPDPTPVIFTGNWNYTTPSQPGTPSSGQISHSDRAKDSLRIHKTDADGGNRSAELAGLSNGDSIEAGGIRWAISAVTDNGTWVDFSVAPQTQISDGLHSFIFETVTASPITVIADTDYYLGNSDIRPFYSIDGGTRVLTDDAYNVDIKIQEITVSDDWDIVAVSGGGSSGVGGGGVGDDNVITVDIVEANVVEGWQVWGDTLVQWGVVAGGSGNITTTFHQPFKTAPIVLLAPEGTTTSGAALSCFVTGPPTTTSFESRARYAYASQAGDILADRRWIAIGEAPDDLKKPKSVFAVGDSEVQEYHDPTDITTLTSNGEYTQSWQIIGKTMRVWGFLQQVTTGAATYTFPLGKTFARPPTVVTAGSRDGTLSTDTSIQEANTTTTQISIRMSGSASIYYEAIGEWDGVS